MSTYISVKNKEEYIVSMGERLSFPHLVRASENFSSGYTNNSIIFPEDGVYKISINLNIKIDNVESFTILAFDPNQNPMQIITSEISYFSIVNPNFTKKEFTVYSSFLHEFNKDDSVYFSLTSLSSGTFHIKPFSNINIFKFDNEVEGEEGANGNTHQC